VTDCVKSIVVTPAARAQIVPAAVDSPLRARVELLRPDPLAYRVCAAKDNGLKSSEIRRAPGARKTGSVFGNPKKLDGSTPPLVLERSRRPPHSHVAKTRNPRGLLVSSQFTDRPAEFDDGLPTHHATSQRAAAILFDRASFLRTAAEDGRLIWIRTVARVFASFTHEDVVITVPSAARFKPAAGVLPRLVCRLHSIAADMAMCAQPQMFFANRHSENVPG